MEYIGKPNSARDQTVCLRSITKKMFHIPHDKIVRVGLLESFLPHVTKHIHQSHGLMRGRQAPQLVAVGFQMLQY